MSAIVFCGAAHFRGIEGRFGPVVPIALPEEALLCKGRCLRISDHLAIQEVNADPSGLRTNILSQIQPNH